MATSMTAPRRIASLLLSMLPLLPLLAPPAAAQGWRALDRASVRGALARAGAELPAVEARFVAGLARRGADAQGFEALFGYDPPGTALAMAWLHAWLFDVEGGDADARAAADLLLRTARYRERVPEELRAARVEYAGGLPAVPSFFQLADFADAWARVRGHASLADDERDELDRALAGSAEFVFAFPEWGAHNRALLRACGLAACARALPEHPRAPDWARMGEVLAADSVGHWEIEDASLYHAIWLQALARYGGEDALRSLQGRAYLRYFLELLTPFGTVADFGDAWWGSSQLRFVELFARGAAALDDPELAWAAERAGAALDPFDPAAPPLGLARLGAELAPLAGRVPPPRAPRLRSGPVLDERIGRKLALRGADDSLLLLNFRDEQGFGRLGRDFLRRTLAVSEEKMHHGHADENAVVLWTHGGAVLLHDAGYREEVPSGPHGAFRADVFHDRVVARAGRPDAGQAPAEFLLDDGAYRPVRAELVDFVAFEALDASRTRVTDDALGYVWDRTLLAPRDAPLVVVVDTLEVTAGSARAARVPLSFARLWATGELVEAGPGWARGRRRFVGAREVPAPRELLLVDPDRRGAPPASFPLRRHAREELVLCALASAGGAPGERLSFVSVLASVAPGGDGDGLPARVERLPCEPAGAGVALRIAAGGGLPELLLVVKADLALGALAADVRPREDPAAATWRAGGVASDADLVVVRRAADGARWSATNVSRLELDGRTAFEARPLQLFQPSGRSDRVGRVRWRAWEGRLAP